MKNFLKEEENSYNCYCAYCGKIFIAKGKRNYCCPECYEKNKEKEEGHK